jgi:hypothetical protein
MKLLWKLLRQHVSTSQSVGFFLANLIGLAIILLGIQFYHDVIPVFTAKDSFMKADYMVLSKKIVSGSVLSQQTGAFAEDEVDEVAAQPFVTQVGTFTLAPYHVNADMGINGHRILSSEIFIESIPDAFMDIPEGEWRYEEGANEVPVILPRSYINMYNFGYAQTHSMPKVSDGLLGMIDLTLQMRGNDTEQTFKGRVVSLSNRMSSILVPQSFMQWSMKKFAPEAESKPTRLVVELNNPADKRIAPYLEEMGYEMGADEESMQKTAHFLRLLVFLVVTIGVIVTILSCYILFLSIFLLIQKNEGKLQNLMLIGYSPKKVAVPYTLLAMLLNGASLLIAFIVVFFIRRYYMDEIQQLFPAIDDGSFMPTIIAGLLIFAVVALINTFLIRRKMQRIWYH